MGLGVVIITGGVVWISIAKNSNYQITDLTDELTEEHILHYRVMGISLVLLAALIGSLRPV